MLHVSSMLPACVFLFSRACHLDHCLLMLDRYQVPGDYLSTSVAQFVACLPHVRIMLNAFCMMQTLHVCVNGKVNGTEMPSGDGAEYRIHAHIGEIKSRDECIAIKFEGVTPYLPAFGTVCPTAYMTACCTVPNH